MISVTISTVKGSCDTDVVKLFLSRDNKVQLVPMLRSGVHPRQPVSQLNSKEGVCNTEVMVRAEF